MSAIDTSSSDRPAQRGARWLPLALLAALAAVLAAGGLWLAAPRKQQSTTPASAAAQPGSAAAVPAALSASQLERGIAGARATVQRNPDDAAAWAMLAHTQEMAGRFEQAVEAYRRLVALRPKDAQAHADFADTLGVVQQGRLQGEPARLIARALELEPGNAKALVLGGKEAFERRRYAEAIALWDRALKASADPALQRPVQTSIAEARALMAPAGASQPATSTGLAFVAGRVSVAPALQSKIGPDDTVFVFARPETGSRMPVALLKRRGSDLPLDFALDDTLAMVASARLSQHPRVMLGARVSRRGDAIAAAGDLEGELGPVALGSTGLRLEITRERP
jgi:cytochrome c-type biogenesis protein CcmH